MPQTLLPEKGAFGDQSRISELGRSQLPFLGRTPRFITSVWDKIQAGHSIMHNGSIGEYTGRRRAMAEFWGDRYACARLRM